MSDPRNKRPAPDEPLERNRRAVSQVGGPIELEGDRALAEEMAEAFRAAERVDPDHHTHGFHSYPGRMHPAIAAGVLRTFAKEIDAHGGPVLDPFCGSGTVLVESLLAGRESVGVDLNPIALRIADVKTSLRGPSEREDFLDLLHAVGEKSIERVQARVDSRAPIPREEVGWYDGHVLKELAGLMAEIEHVEENRPRRALEMLFSAIVIKFSRQRSDTRIDKVQKRIRKGLATEFWVRRGEELLARWADLYEDVPKGLKPPSLHEGDSRKLSTFMAGAKASIVITSPPYGATYNYVDHHARRYPWLRMETNRFFDREIGARRSLQGPDAIVRWNQELSAALRAMASVMGKEAYAILVLGDAEIERHRIRAVDQVRHLAPGAEFEFCAAASQKRKDWRGGFDRAESIIVLRHRPNLAPRPSGPPRNDRR